MENQYITIPKFGEIFYANLKVDGHVQGGIRPVIIIQNNIGNKYSPTVTIIPLSSKIDKMRDLPIHVAVDKTDAIGLDKDSIALVEQLQTINKIALREKIAKVSDDCLRRIRIAHEIQCPFPA